jgi:hypothetical protein
MSDFSTGQGTATETPTPIVGVGYQPEQLFRGITIRAMTGLVYISRSDVSLAMKYPLSAGSQIEIPIGSPSKIYVSGNGTYAWFAV